MAMTVEEYKQKFIELTKQMESEHGDASLVKVDVEHIYSPLERMKTGEKKQIVQDYRVTINF